MITVKGNKFYAITPKKKRKKLVGVLDGWTFRKKIQFSKHFFWKARALGIDSELIPFLEKAGVKTIVLIDTESDRRYTTSFKRFKRYSWVHTFRGFDPQQFMALDKWNIWEGNKLVQEVHLDNDEIQPTQQLIAFDVKARLAKEWKKMYASDNQTA